MEQQLGSAITLERTLAGRITRWSPGMETRYGFSRAEALGHTSSDLLRTILPGPETAIKAALATHGIWIGGVINHRADGRAVATVSRWDIHLGGNGEDSSISEEHSDLAQAGIVELSAIADVVGTAVRELIEALTAVRFYNAGIQLALADLAWPNPEPLYHGTAKIADQVSRCAERLRVLRDVANLMREVD
ncbi:MAG TPA: hypothetical protein VKI44_15590 [Acetobacteraceae bacterium]|nr:hypothetical protein [Acetobacteraceae bacterium]